MYIIMRLTVVTAGQRVLVLMVRLKTEAQRLQRGKHE